MKKILLTVLACLALVGQGYSQEKVSLYNANEFAISLNSGYVLNTSAPFQQDYSFNLGAGASYFFTRNFGVEASVPFYQTKGVSVDEVQFGLLARLPIGPVAPYAGVGGVYNWDSEENLAYIGKAGLEIRINNKWSTFVEGQYRNNDFTWDRGSISLVGGIKLIF